MDVLAFIPARGGSKGIPYKNLVSLGGKPLIQYTIEAAKGSQIITRIVISTDDDRISEVGTSMGIEVANRPQTLAGDNTVMLDVIDYHLEEFKKEGYIPDAFLILQPTSPLRNSNHIDEALHSLIDDPNADALVSVVELPHLYSPNKIMKLDEAGYLEFYMKDGEKYTIRQNLPKYYARNGAAIYAVMTDAYEKTHSLYGTRCKPYIMSEAYSVDIDEASDLELAEFYMTMNSRQDCDERMRRSL